MPYRKRLRSFGFIIGFAVVLILPVSLALLYNHEFLQNQDALFLQHQAYATEKITDAFHTEYRNFRILLRAADYFPARPELLDENLRRFFEDYNRVTPLVAGYALYRNGVRYREAVFTAENYSTVAADTLLTNFKQADGAVLPVAVVRHPTGVTTFATVAPLTTAPGLRLVVFFNLDKFINRLLQDLVRPEYRGLLLVGAGGEVFYNSVDPERIGPLDGLLSLEGKDPPLSLSAAEEGAKVVHCRNPGDGQPALMILSWKRRALAGSHFHVLLFTPEAALHGFLERIEPRLFLMHGALLMVTVTLGIFYYRIRTRAYQALARASQIPGLEQTIAELDHSRGRYQRLFDSIMDGIVTHRQDGTILECNTAFSDMLGYERDQVPGQTMRRLTPPRFWDLDEIKLGKNLQDWRFTRDYEKEFVRLDGSLVPVLINSTLVEAEEGDSILSIVKDISAQKRAEMEIAKLNAHLRGIVDSSPSSIITLDENLGIASLNNAAENLLAVAREAVQGQPVFEAIPVLSRFRELIERVRSEKESRTLPQCQLPIGEGGGKCTNITFYPLHGDAAGGLAIHIEDITEQVSLQRQLYQSQKMEALGTLASGFAHDFNNLLSGILANLSVLRMRSHDPEILEKVETVAGIALRASSLVQHISTFTRVDEIRAQAVSVRRLVDEVLEIISRSLPKNITIEDRVPEDSCHILGDPSQLSQVLLNLCINARDAMPDGGTLTLELEEVEIRAEDTARFRWLEPGRTVKLMVSDTGCGIPPEIRDRIFDPFFTTKEKGKGTGLGLSIVYGVLKNHKSDITVFSLPGEGTTFSVYLPLADPANDPPVEAEAVPSLPHPAAGGTILIIDDEQVLCNALTDGFSRLGYTVYAAHTGKRGIALFREHRIDLVILDMIMPELSGEATFDLLRKEDPEARILIHTGFTEPATLERMLERGALAVLTKPYDFFRLADLVEKIIKDRPQPPDGNAEDPGTTPPPSS